MLQNKVEEEELHLTELILLVKGLKQQGSPTTMALFQRLVTERYFCLLKL